MQHILLAQKLISNEMDFVSGLQQLCEVGDECWTHCQEKIEALIRAHQVVEEKKYLTPAGRAVVIHWLRSEVSGVPVEDISEAAYDGFDGSLEMVGAMYLMKEHSYRLEREWEEVNDEGVWEG